MGQSVDDFYRVVNSANAEIAADPGRRFFYSNEGFRVIGNIIQEVSGMPFHEYIHETYSQAPRDEEEHIR